MYLVSDALQGGIIVLDGYPIGWLILCIAVGYFAKGKGKNAFAWGIGAFFFSPFLAAILLALSKDDKIKEQVVQVAMEQQQLKDRVAMGEIATNKKIQAVEQSIGTLGTGVEKLQNTTNQDLIAGGRTCPNCGQIIKRNAAICRYCGTEIEEQAMVECPFCKELIRADATRCKYCRSEVSPNNIEQNTIPIIECPFCKELISKDAKFCEFCGGKLPERQGE